MILPFCSKCSNEAVFAADFHPTDANIIVTCGKSHLYFWTLEGSSLIKKQGLFEVTLNCIYFIFTSGACGQLASAGVVRPSAVCEVAVIANQEVPLGL